MELPFSSLQTPCYVVDEALLERNLVILKQVIDRTGCKILLAQKAFSMFACYPLIGSYLNGTTASGLFEARLGKEEMGGETHIFSPAYREDEIDEILSLCDHVIFNSFSQWEKYRDKVLASGKSAGLRLNPEYSTQDHAIYDPCSPGSRLGITLKKFRPDLLDGIEGLHFHTLCEQDAAPLVETVAVVEEKFGPWLSQMKWLNFGGGHHITRPGYDIDALVSCVSRVQERYGVQVYLEPGEAVSLNAGFLVSTVLDVLENSGNIAVLDTSAACHMPDVLEMPYRPPIAGGGGLGEKAYDYRLGGPTCLAGDVIGDYSFDEPLSPGSRVVFCDMAIYSMVKNNTFNGMNLPAIYLKKQDGSIQLVRKFGYEDFKTRLS